MSISNAMGIMLFKVAMKLVRDGNDKQGHAQAEKFVAQLNDPTVKMTRTARILKQTFVKGHGLVDKIESIIPSTDAIISAIPK